MNKHQLQKILKNNWLFWSIISSLAFIYLRLFQYNAGALLNLTFYGSPFAKVTIFLFLATLFYSCLYSILSFFKKSNFKLLVIFFAQLFILILALICPGTLINSNEHFISFRQNQQIIQTNQDVIIMRNKPMSMIINYSKGQDVLFNIWKNNLSNNIIKWDTYGLFGYEIKGESDEQVAYFGEGVWNQWSYSLEKSRLGSAINKDQIKIERKINYFKDLNEAKIELTELKDKHLYLTAALVKINQKESYTEYKNQQALSYKIQYVSLDTLLKQGFVFLIIMLMGIPIVGILIFLISNIRLPNLIIVSLKCILENIYRQKVCLIIIVLIITALILKFQNDRTSMLTQVSNIYENDDNLEGFEVYPYDLNKGLYIVLKDDFSTIDELFLVCFKKGKVQWEKGFSSSRNYSDIKVLKIKGIKEKVIQLYSDDRGFGFFQLYIVKSNKLVKLVKTVAVDYYEDQDIWDSKMIVNYYIRNKKLKPNFRDLNNDGIADLILSGNVDYYKYKPALLEADEKLIGTGFWQKVFLFNPAIGKYQFDKERTRYQSDFEYRADYIKNESKIMSR